MLPNQGASAARSKIDSLAQWHILRATVRVIEARIRPKETHARIRENRGLPTFLRGALTEPVSALLTDANRGPGALEPADEALAHDALRRCVCCSARQTSFRESPGHV